MDVDCCVIFVAYRLIVCDFCFISNLIGESLDIFAFSVAVVYLHRNYELPNLHNSGVNRDFTIALDLLLAKIF